GHDDTKGCDKGDMPSPFPAVWGNSPRPPRVVTVRDHREEAEENVPEFRKPRPLPRPQRWTLDVAASGTVESWHDPAKRLVDLLRTISTAIQEHYGESLSWRASRGEPSVWSSSEELA